MYQSDIKSYLPNMSPRKAETWSRLQTVTQAVSYLLRDQGGSMFIFLAGGSADGDRDQCCMEAYILKLEKYITRATVWSVCFETKKGEALISHGDFLVDFIQCSSSKINFSPNFTIDFCKLIEAHLSSHQVPPLLEAIVQFPENQ